MNGAQRGFTLIEIIVVVLVFAVMSAMAYGGLNSVLRTRVAIEEALTRNAAMQRSYFRLRNDFQNLRNRPIRDAFGDAQPALATDREGRVTLTRGGWRNPLLFPRASFERVSWRVEDRKLLRTSWRVLDQAQDSKPVELAVLDKVVESKWRFLGDGDEWVDTWPPDTISGEERSAAAPPRAVELSLTTEDWGQLKFLFEAGAPPNKINFDALGTAGSVGNEDPQEEEPIPDEDPEPEVEIPEDPTNTGGDGEQT